MSAPTYRIAHYGTGDTGSEALRTLIARPEFELVAHLVHSPEKVGRDSGEIAGVAPVGVLATADLDEFLSVDADCVRLLRHRLRRVTTTSSSTRCVGCSRRAATS